MLWLRCVLSPKGGISLNFVTERFIDVFGIFKRFDFRRRLAYHGVLIKSYKLLRDPQLNNQFGWGY